MANAFTRLGAVCFCAGAYLLLPRFRRNVSRVVLGEAARA